MPFTTPFIIQARRLISGPPLQIYCQTSAWYASVMRYTYGLTQYYTASNLPHQIVSVPDARIIGVNGRTIPSKWLVEDRYNINGTAGGNMMLIDAQWAETDFTIEEVL